MSVFDYGSFTPFGDGPFGGMTAATGAVRWQFYDPVEDETWTMPINPDSMTSPLRVRARSALHAHGGELVVSDGDPGAHAWDFGGVIRTKAHHDALIDWATRDRAIDVTDHLERTFRVVVTACEIADRRPTPRTQWRLRYVMRTLILEAL